MKKGLVAVLVVLCGLALSAQAKPVIVVNAFSAASDVSWPYDMKQMQAQAVAELKVMLGKEFDVVAETPADPPGSVYTLDTKITGWRAGNAAKRLIVGFGSGRESADVEYQVADKSGQKVVDGKDTIRTNFYSQGAGSIGTLTHPIAQKIADRIKKAKLK